MSTGQTSSITPWTIDAEMAVREKIRLVGLAAEGARAAAVFRIEAARAREEARLAWEWEGGANSATAWEEQEAQRLTEVATQHNHAHVVAAAAAHNQPPTTAAKAEAAERARQKTH
jgi:chemotaxis response regulator CheB